MSGRAHHRTEPTAHAPQRAAHCTVLALGFKHKNARLTRLNRGKTVDHQAVAVPSACSEPQDAATSTASLTQSTGDAMKGQQERVLDACRRVQSFMDANATLLDGINKSATRKELDGVITDRVAGAGAQATAQVAAKGESANQRILRLALRDHMRRIAAVAFL